MLALLRRWFSTASERVPDTINPSDQPPANGPATNTQAGSDRDWQLNLASIEQFGMQLAQPLLADSAESLEYLEKLLQVTLSKVANSPSGGSDLLPRVPAILPQILKSLRDKNLSTTDLAQQISKDVLLVAELLQEVRRPIYNARLTGGHSLQQLDKAIQLLGVNGMRLLIAKNAFRPLIQNQRGHLTQQMAPVIWQHTDLTVQLVQLLARRRKIDELPVFLAALLLNVGMVIALRAIDQMGFVQQLPSRPELLQRLLCQAQQLSLLAGRHWQFPDEVCQLLAASAGSSADPSVRVLQQASQLALLHLMQTRLYPPALQVCEQLPAELAMLMTALDVTQA